MEWYDQLRGNLVGGANIGNSGQYSNASLAVPRCIAGNLNQRHPLKEGFLGWQVAGCEATGQIIGAKLQGYTPVQHVRVRLAHCWVLDTNRARDRERAQRGKAVWQIAQAPAKEDARLDRSMSAKLAAAARQSPAEPGREQRFMEIVAEEQPLKPDLS